MLRSSRGQGRATETPRPSLANEPRCAESTKGLPALCGQQPEADRPAVAAVAWGARAGSFPIGHRLATDRIAPSALPPALFASAIPLHGKITTANLALVQGFEMISSLCGLATVLPARVLSQV